MFKSLILLLALVTFALSEKSDSCMITVEGVGKVETMPDIATLNIGIRITDEKMDDIVSKIENAMKGIVKIIDKYKIPKEDVKIDALELRPNDNYSATGSTYKQNQNIGNKSIRVTLKTLAVLPDFFEDLMKSPANNISAISYSSSKQDSLESIALQIAVDNARHKAAMICSKAGLKLSDIYTIHAAKNRERYDYSEYTHSVSKSTTVYGVGEEVKRIQPGKITFSQSVLIIFKFNK
jgi:uncharacterized protein YggE